MRGGPGWCLAYLPSTTSIPANSNSSFAR
jgi:hypothetical protein